MAGTMSDHKELCAKMSDQRIDTAKIRACSALLGEPSVTVVWQLANEIDRLTAESAQKDARIAELEAATRWRPMSALPSYAKGRRAIIPVIGITGYGRAVAPVVRALNGLMYDEGGVERTLAGWMPIPPFKEPKP